MSQIRIEEERKNKSILPWIIGLLILGLVIWGVAEAFEEGDELEAVNTEVVESPDRATLITDDNDSYGDDTYTSEAYLGAIDAYMNYTTDINGEMGLDHEFSHEALTLLAAATESIADAKGIDITQNTARAKQLADNITKDPFATDHADQIRMAAINLTETLERINQYADSNVSTADLDNLRKEAQAINAKTLTLNQKEDVRSFFRAARGVLSKMK